jgi:alkanesulfonate monooxygenase SsuD/methylene tetrahydromethanopterin reductase-like flavin-dependent oxidoreductase (luciferase family)
MSEPLGLALGLPPHPRERERLLERAAVADDLGVHSLWVAEATGRDVVTFLAELALRTARVQLGTGIISPYGRSPATLAMTFATLDELSGGRMLLGIGAGGANVAEHWHGVRFRQPLRRIRETVEIINAVLAGTPLNYAGQHFDLRRGLRLGFEPVRPHIPIFVAATTEPSIRQAGEVADGVMPIHWPSERYADLRAMLAAGAAIAGRSAAGLWLAPSVNLVIRDELTPEPLARAREAIAHYIGRMGSAYPEMLRRYGYEAEVADVQAAWARRDSAAAAIAVSDRLLDATTVIGTVDRCRDKLQELRQRGADLPIVAMPSGDSRTVGRLLERLLR